MCCARYWLDPYSLFFIEVILVQFAELRRWQDFRNPGSQGKQYFLGLEEVLKGSGNPSYPGQCTARQIDAYQRAPIHVMPFVSSCTCRFVLRSYI